MAIKTLLVAGMATFGLCTGAFAQTQFTGQTNTAGQAAALGGPPTQRQTITQGRALANVAVQSQNATLVNTVAQIAAQTNVATPVSAPVIVNVR